MPIITISYSSGEPYYNGLQERLVRNCRRFGLEHNVYNKHWLHKTKFYELYKSLLDEKRGAGFWVWKPYIMIDAMSKMSENDVVVYMDASTTMNSDPTSTIESVKDLLVCDSAWVNKNWIKRDCFHFMHCDSDMYYNATQVWAGVVIARITSLTKEFMIRWLNYCTDRRIVSDDPNVSGENLPEFIDHRHDQSILTLLVTQYIKEYEELGIETRPTLPFTDG